MTLPIARITTVLAPATRHWLVDLETTKDELSIDDDDSSNDAWLARAIGQVSRGIERYCKRPFAPEYLQDAFQFARDPARDGLRFAGDDELALARWPLLSVVSVIQSLPDGNTRTLIVGTDFVADMARGRLLRLTPDGQQQRRWEALPVAVQYTAGYGALVTETQTVPGTPFQVTVSGSPTFSCDQQVSYASGAALQRVAANPTQGQYVVGNGGVYTFAAGDAGQALTFEYATSKIPADLEEIVLRLVTARFNAKDRDPALIQRDTPGIGTERWWFGGAPGQKGPFPPEVQGLLDDYRTPTVA